MSAPAKISDAALDQIVESLGAGISQTKVAAMHGVSQQAIAKRLKDPAVRRRVDAAVRANRRRKRNAQLRSARKFRRQQGIDSSMRTELAGPVVPVDPTEKARSEERALRRGRLPDDPGTVIAAPKRGITHPGRVPTRMRYRDGGRLLVSRASDAQCARLDQTDYDRQHGLYECRLRDSGGLELRHGCFDRETTRKLVAESEPWEVIAVIHA